MRVAFPQERDVSSGCRSTDSLVGNVPDCVSRDPWAVGSEKERAYYQKRLGRLIGPMG